jgi:hypothetical protein
MDAALSRRDDEVTSLESITATVSCALEAHLT